MSELKRRLFKVVGDAGQSESSRPEPIEEIREGIAQLLKQTRERYGQSLRDVSANLRIRMAYLQAIENGRFRELPGPTYAVGFVRSYAEYLGLDAAEIVRRFKGEVEGLDHRTHLAFPEPVPEGKVPGGAIIIISLLVLVIGYGGWYAITSRDADGTGLIPRISENLKSLVGSEEPPVEVTATPSATSPAPASAPSSPDPAAVAIVSTPAPVSVPVSSAPVPLAPQSGSDTSAEQPAAAPATSLGAGENASAGLIAVPATAPAVAADSGEPSPEGSAAAAADTAAQEVAVGSTEEDEAPAQEDAAIDDAAVPDAPAIPDAPQLATAPEPAPAARDPAAPSSTAPGKVVLHARLTSWIQIADAAGQPIVIRTLQAGETLDLPVQPGLTLFTGNAGGLEIVLDGQPLAPLGPVGAVRRGISLDPEALRGGQAVE
jgi:cytoskeleton protein RodZ